MRSLQIPHRFVLSVQTVSNTDQITTHKKQGVEMTKSTNGGKNGTYVQICIYHKNYDIAQNLRTKITDFLTSILNIEDKCINFLFFETQTEEEHAHMNVTVKVEVYRDPDVDEEKLSKDIYKHIELQHFRLTLIVEKRDGMVIKNY